MAFHDDTLELFEHVKLVLSEYSEPITVRQCFYRLVAAQVLENTQNRYKSLVHHLVNAREEGIIDPAAFEDRTRSADRRACYNSLSDYIDKVSWSYHRDCSTGQPLHVEVWCEKEALASIFERAAWKYDVHVLSCRGYNSLSVLHKAGKRFAAADKPVHVLYFGDFDPSGQDMVRDIRDRLETWAPHTETTVHTIALTPAQIQEYDLPPAPAKTSDTRSKSFINKHGSMSAVELDALPPDVLAGMVEEAILDFFDKSQFEQQQQIEEREQTELKAAMKRLRDR